MNTAYLYFANGHLTPPPYAVIEVGADWINFDRYMINAKAAAEESQEMMKGPMLQALLEDRFKLKLRRETREIPVYNLTVAKGGVKNLKPFKEGSCFPNYLTSNFTAVPSGEKACRVTGGPKGSNMAMQYSGVSLSEFSSLMLGRIDGRPVIDQTGIAGRFDLDLEYAPENAAEARLYSLDPTGGTSIFTALPEQLGLRLEPGKGPAEFFVIDHAEKPSEN